LVGRREEGDKGVSIKSMDRKVKWYWLLGAGTRLQWNRQTEGIKHGRTPRKRRQKGIIYREVAGIASNKTIEQQNNRTTGTMKPRTVSEGEAAESQTVKSKFALVT
jgi:hypothetical protein